MSGKERIFLDKILKSEEFFGAQKYQELLKYLVEASLKGQIPKEITIAHDVFLADVKKDMSSESKVRVYIHNLRKKLDSYYINEGKDDEIQLEIPKGHYQVTFICKSKPAKIDNRKVKTIVLVAISLLLTSLVSNLYFITSNQSKINIESQIKRDNPFWIEYIESELPTLIVFGDYFMYKDRQIPNRNRYIRDYEINTPHDLDQFLNDNTSYKDHIIATGHTYLGKLAPWCLYDLHSIMLPFDTEIELKLSSQLQWDDLDKYNIIFVGSFKTFGIFSELIKKLHFTYQIKPNMLYYHPEDADTSFAYHATRSQPNGPSETDYAVIVKFPGPMNNVITMFASTRDIGCLATVDLMTKPVLLLPFIDKHLKPESEIKFFEAIFKVQGYDRTVTNTDLLHFNILDNTE